MHPSRAIIRALAALALLATLALSTASSAQADSQTDLVTPTAWRFRVNVSLTTLNADLADGYRIVDLEIEDDSPFRVSAVMVHNSGDYAKGWWWYFGQTSSQVLSLMAANNARLIDVEPYDTSSGLRYAVVMIPNTGSDFASQHGWQTGYSFTGVVNWLNANTSRRIIDIQPYMSGSNQRYAFIWVQNTGQQQSTYWIYMNTTAATISSRLNSNNARLIDLEIHEGSGGMSAIMVPNDGNEWLWFYGLQFSDVERLALQYASRMIDIQRYPNSFGSARYAMVLRRNDNDLTIDANFAMRNHLPLGASSGLLLREFNGATSTMAGNLESDLFEPASLMKTVHHFVATRQVALGNLAFNTSVTEATGLNGSCPTGTNPVSRDLDDVLRSMMEQSSNTATEAIRALLGTGFIESQAASFGATGVALNHTLGCLCGMTRNQVTLLDLADLHESVVAGALLGVKDEFYDLMVNSGNFGMGTYNTSTIVSQELASSSLSSVERAAFLAGIRIAAKGGSYTCIAGSNREDHRSRGAYVRLPHRSGCDTVFQEYFIGAWVNDAVTNASANDAVGAGLVALYRDRVRAAINTWEAASCNPFVNYCTAAANSTGSIGVSSATGTSYLVSNNLVLRASQLPTNSFGFLLVAQTQGFTANAGGSSGNLCLGGAVGRYQNFITSTGSTGTLTRPINSNGIPQPSGQPYVVQPGETLNFQWWHRDATSLGTTTSNFTNGLEVTFI